MTTKACHSTEEVAKANATVMLETHIQKALESERASADEDSKTEVWEEAMAKKRNSCKRAITKSRANIDLDTEKVSRKNAFVINGHCGQRTNIHTKTWSKAINVTCVHARKFCQEISP